MRVPLKLSLNKIEISYLKCGHYFLIDGEIGIITEQILINNVLSWDFPVFHVRRVRRIFPFLVGRRLEFL